MEHHVLVIHPGDKDLITTQIAARNEKTILFIKTQRGAGRLADNLAKTGGVVVLATTKQQTSVKGLTSPAGVTPKFVCIKPNDGELMTITGAQEPSRIPCITPITESRGPSRSGSKRPSSNSSQKQRRPR
jgi:hypothetical protein